MSAAGSHLQGAACHQLPAHIRHIRAQPDTVGIVAGRLGGGQLFGAAQVQNDLLCRAGGIDRQPLGNGCFGGIFGGQEQLLDAVLHGSQRHGQHTVDRAQRAVQTQLAQKGALAADGGQLALRRHNADKHRQVIDRSRFAHIGGRQIDRDAAGGPLVMQVFQRTAHTLAAFFYGGIRQTDHRKLRQPARQVGFDLHGISVQPGNAQTVHLCIHKPPLYRVPRNLHPLLINIHGNRLFCKSSRYKKDS